MECLNRKTFGPVVERSPVNSSVPTVALFPAAVQVEPLFVMFPKQDRNEPEAVNVVPPSDRV